MREPRIIKDGKYLGFPYVFRDDEAKKFEDEANYCLDKFTKSDPPQILTEYGYVCGGDPYVQYNDEFVVTKVDENTMPLSPPTTVSDFDYRPFWLSIRKAKKCLFSRRLGYRGKLILGYSVCLRLFGKTII